MIKRYAGYALKDVAVHFISCPDKKLSIGWKMVVFMNFFLRYLKLMCATTPQKKLVEAEQ